MNGLERALNETVVVDLTVGELIVLRAAALTMLGQELVEDRPLRRAGDLAFAAAKLSERLDEFKAAL